MSLNRQLTVLTALTVLVAGPVAAQRTVKPPLHGRHWMAITGKPLGATAGAMMFAKGGNAVDATAAMLAAVCTMWDTLGCGGETQALIWHPGLKKVIGINAWSSAKIWERSLMGFAKYYLRQAFFRIAFYFSNEIGIRKSLLNRRNIQGFPSL